MTLSDVHIEAFARSGYLLLPELFSRQEIELLKSELPALFAAAASSRIMEADGHVVRSVYGSHRTSELCQQLTRHPRLLLPARQLLRSDVYVHQFKINAKAALGGDRWEWHQDYIFWRNEDGMPANRVVNVAVYLDDVTEFNGPILLLEGSHHEGVIEPRAVAVSGWESHLSASLTYALDAETVKRLVGRWSMRAAKGPAGTVLMFDPNLVHGSSPNMSPFDRAIAMVTFNSTENVLPLQTNPRPEFLASRDFRPLTPVTDDVWTSAAGRRAALAT